MGGLELFAGAGGLALGGSLAGLHHRALIELNARACRTLERNAALFTTGQKTPQIICADVRDIDCVALGHIEVVTGGPPCQPFSLGGKALAYNDKRDLFPAAIAVIRATRPLAFVLENVKGLLRRSFQPYFAYIIQRLTYPEIELRAGESWTEHSARLKDIAQRGGVSAAAVARGLSYQVSWQLLQAADYGVPQCRERVFIVGLRSDVRAKMGSDFVFPQPTHAQGRLLYEQYVSHEYWARQHLAVPAAYSSKDNCPMQAVQDFARSPLKPWRTLREALTGLPPYAASSVEAQAAGLSGHVLQRGAKSYAGHTGSVWDWPAKTIKAGVHSVPGGENMIALGEGQVRYLTVREAARVQCFPDKYVFADSWSESMRQIGNAVPVTLAQTVIAAVLKTLRQVSK